MCRSVRPAALSLMAFGARVRYALRKRRSADLRSSRLSLDGLSWGALVTCQTLPSVAFGGAVSA
jgi:hypothetical protein